MPYAEDGSPKTKVVGEFVMCPFVGGSLVGKDICNTNCQFHHSAYENGGRNYVMCKFPVSRNFVKMEVMDAPGH